MLAISEMKKLSTQQKRVINDDRVNWEGWDAKERPVVSLDDWRGFRRWAVLRNGDPTDVTEPVTKPET